MERLTFIPTGTHQQISCLLNPEHLVQTRVAGLRRPRSGSGPVSGARLSDEPVLHTGGGRTVIDLELLFDLGLAPDSPQITDVRQLTRPLWDLTENRLSGPDAGTTPSVRAVWGKDAGLVAVVEAIAERLEAFDSAGAPHRSWIRLRLRRIPDPTPPPIEPDAVTVPVPEEVTAMATDAEPGGTHTALSGGVDDAGVLQPAERLDQLAARYYDGRPWLWRLIAAANDLDDAPWAPAGHNLIIPEAPGGEEPR
jgi:hypothetical protein